MPLVKPRRPVLNRGHPLARGLVGAWPLWERGGTTVRDLRDRRTGSLNNNASWVVDRYGPAISLDGTGDYVQVATMFSNPTRLTIAVLVNVSSYGSASASDVVSIGDHATIRVASTGAVSGFYRKAGATNTITAAGAHSTGIWYWLVYVCAPSDGVQGLYVNGALKAAGTATDAIVYDLGTVTRFGRQGNTATTVDLGGKIADVRIWARALKASEIASMYANPWALYRGADTHRIIAPRFEQAIRR